MIVVKLFIWPGGDESKAVEIGHATLANQTITSLRTGGYLGDYTVKLHGGVHGRPELSKRVWKKGTITGFHRVERGAWDLLYLALRNLIGDRA